MDPQNATPPTKKATLDARGLFLQPSGAERAEFIPWTGEACAQEAIEALKEAGGGRLRFAPGEYPFESGMRIDHAPNITISGSPGTLLHFAPEPTTNASLLVGLSKGDKTMQFDDASGIRVGRRYQLYSTGPKPHRLLEFLVQRIDGQTIAFAPPVRFLSHVTEIPKGSKLIDELNLFRIHRSDHVVLENLVMQGRDRGAVVGHTTFCGVFASGVVRKGQRPTTQGLTIRGCSLTGFRGRGICAYSIANVSVESCHFDSIKMEAVEIDHFSSGQVIGNFVSNAGVGLSLNDAFDTMVADNVVVHCGTAITFVAHFIQPEFNTGLVVQDNIVVAKGKRAVVIRKEIKGNIVRGNLFEGLTPELWIQGDLDNTIEDNQPFRPNASAALDLRGFFIRPNGVERSKFVHWKNEQTAQAALTELKSAEGGILRFTPGQYEISTSLRIENSNHIQISGTTGVVFHFAPEPEVRPTLEEPALIGDTTLTLDDPRHLTVGHAYQLYLPNLKGDRILEFRVKRIEDNLVHLTRPVAFLSHVQEIPKGSAVIDEVHIFRLYRSGNITIANLTMQGRERGDVRGHTTYCAVFASGVVRRGQPATTRGLTIRGCDISGFEGRGFCAYSIADVLVENCKFDGIDSQAVELDHFSSGRVLGNDVRDAGVGIALNDAFESTVSSNRVADCQTAIAFVAHFKEPMFNTGLRVEDNLLMSQGKRGVEIREGIEGNWIRGNVFEGILPERWVHGDPDNVVKGNRALR